LLTLLPTLSTKEGATASKARLSYIFTERKARQITSWNNVPANDLQVPTENQERSRRVFTES
jgi:hypothetical protein